MASFAACSVLCSGTASARGATARIIAASKPRDSPHFRISTQKPISTRIFRSPVEMGSLSVMSMLPYHTATASAVLTSMLSVAPRRHAWTLEGWKANPVEFYSVFNRSRHTFAFGSPDIIPIFCGALQHSTWKSYPHEFEDFATDASFLDEWSLDQIQSLLNRSNSDAKLKQLLQQDNLVIFLHLLGCDSNGHAHRPYSPIYLNNVKVVDHIAERVYNLVQSYVKDNLTAYLFTADHGMSDKGIHGDGHPSNTDTPLVAWELGLENLYQVLKIITMLILLDFDIKIITLPIINKLKKSSFWHVRGF